MCTAALKYASRRICVLPVNGKKIPLTSHGVHDASCVPAEVTSMWRRHPEANVGVATGVRSGVVVLDIDRKRGVDGVVTLRELERRYGKLPQTAVSETPSGGYHLWFKAPAVSLRCSAGRLHGVEAPGFDVRADGGYVVAPPSHVEGVLYHWVRRRRLAELPSAWIDALAKKRADETPVPDWKPSTPADADRLKAWCKKALEYEARELASAPEGTRNEALVRSSFKMATLVHTQAYDVGEIRRAVRWATARWQSQTPHKDAATMERGIAAGLARPRKVAL